MVLAATLSAATTWDDALRPLTLTVGLSGTVTPVGATNTSVSVELHFSTLP